MPQLQPVSFPFGRYADLVARGVVYSAYATLTAPVIWSTAAGTGGPLIYNPSTSTKVIHLLGLGVSVSVVTTVAGGLVVGTGTSTAPSATTAIDLLGNLLAGGPASSIATSVFRLGTVSAACTAIVPVAQVHTGALTTDTSGFSFIDLGGIAQAGPGKFITCAGTATLSTLQVQIAAIYAEL